jgi:2-iminobutanoate/2-iminopropanoate deaminase
MQTRNINAENAAQPAAAYTQAVEVVDASRMLFISGQLGTDMNGAAPSTMEEQARLAWRNLGAQLQAAGMSFDNLVKIVMFIPDASEIPASRQARLEAIGDRRPASTVIVSGLAHPEWKIEIEAIACA